MDDEEKTKPSDPISEEELDKMFPRNEMSVVPGSLYLLDELEKLAPGIKAEIIANRQKRATKEN